MADPAIHLRPTAELAPRVLLPGDPGRALLLAQTLLREPRMFNHHRGLWGYTGLASDGEPLTIQATGMGGPSTAIVGWELIELGARELVRVGTCGALSEGLELGDLVVATEALAGDGASRALGASERVAPDPRLLGALRERAGATVAGPVVSTDLFYAPDGDPVARWRAAGAVAVEMEAATLFRLAELRGAAAACVLAVSDVVAGDERSRLDEEGMARAGEAVGAAGAAAFGLEAVERPG